MIRKVLAALCLIGFLSGVASAEVAQRIELTKGQKSFNYITGRSSWMNTGKRFLSRETVDKYLDKGIYHVSVRLKKYSTVVPTPEGPQKASYFKLTAGRSKTGYNYEINGQYINVFRR